MRMEAVSRKTGVASAVFPHGNCVEVLPVPKYKAQREAGAHRHNNMTAASPPDADLSAIGRRLGLILLKAAGRRRKKRRRTTTRRRFLTPAPLISPAPGASCRDSVEETHLYYMLYEGGFKRRDSEIKHKADRLKNECRRALDDM